MSQENTVKMYCVSINDNIPKNAKIYVLNVRKEQYFDTITYVVDGKIPNECLLFTKHIDDSSLNGLQSWGPNNSSHIYVTLNKDTAMTVFEKLLVNVKAIQEEFRREVSTKITVVEEKLASKEDWLVES